MRFHGNVAGIWRARRPCFANKLQTGAAQMQANHFSGKRGNVRVLTENQGMPGKSLAGENCLLLTLSLEPRHCLIGFYWFVLPRLKDFFSLVKLSF